VDGPNPLIDRPWARAQDFIHRNLGAIMIRRHLTAAGLVLICACSVQTGGNAAPPADTGMVSAKKPDTLVSALQAKGSQAQLTTAGGEPAIKSGTGGVHFTLFFEN